MDCAKDGKHYCKGDKSLNPIVGWGGGKTKLKKKIISIMPEHKTYVEPFIGGASVFLSKPLAEKNVINDKNGGLIKMYKDFSQNGCKVINNCKLPENEAAWQKSKANMNKNSCAFIGAIKRSYGSKIGNFSNAGKERGSGVVNTQKTCADHEKKLKAATILNQDFETVAKKYDGKNTLTYMDPPYVGTKLRDLQTYAEVPSAERVCKVAKSLKGKVILSYNVDPEVKKHCAGLKFHTVNTKYEMQRSETGQPKDKKEFLITNF